MAAPTTTAPANTRPPTLWGVFLLFLTIGATGVGGGLSAHIQRSLLQRGWMDEADFLEGLTLAQLLPGANIPNLAAFVGMRLAGGWGALLAVIGVVLPGMLAMLGLAWAYLNLKMLGDPRIEALLHGVAAAAVGLVLAFVAQVAPVGLRVVSGPLVALAAFVMIGLLRWPMALVVVGLFPVSLWLNRPQRAQGAAITAINKAANKAEDERA
jgi:chromate transporter